MQPIHVGLAAQALGLVISLCVLRRRVLLAPWLENCFENNLGFLDF